MAGTVRIAILAQAAQAKAEMAAVGAAGQTMERQLTGTGSRIASALKLGAVAGGAALLGLGKLGLSTASQMEQAEISFTTMLGSGAKAKAFIAELTTFAANTPFEFPGLQKSASQLIAAGVDSKKVIPILTTLGDVTSGMGTGAEGIDRATVAIQQMVAAQKINAEDLNQLRDAGIPVYDLLAAATGKSKQEVVGLAQAGKLGKKELDALLKGLETGKGLERFSGLMAKQSQSLSGLFSTLKDNFGQGLAKALAPAIPQIKKIVGDIGAALPGIFEKVIGALGAVMPAFVAAWNAAKAAISVVVAVLSNPVFQTVAAAVIAMVAAWAAYQKILAIARAATLAFAAAQAILTAVMAANPIALIVIALIGLAAAIVVAYQRSETFRTIVQAVWTAIKAVVSAVINWFAANIPKLWDTAQAVWRAIQTGASAAWNAIRAVVSTVVNAITVTINGYRAVAAAVWNAVQVTASAVWNQIRTVVNAVITAITVTINAYRTAAVAVWNAVRAAGETAWNALRATVTAVINAIRATILGIQTQAVAVWNAIRSAAVSAWNGIQSAISSVISGIGRTLSGLVNTVRSAFSNAGSLLVSAGRAIVQGLISGIQAMASQAAAAAVRVVTNAINAARSALRLGSPSRVFRGLGRLSGRGYVVGLLDQVAAARDAARSLVAAPDSVAPVDIPAIDVTRPFGGPAPGSQTTVLELRSSGNRTDDLLLELLRRSVRARGGNVQVALMGR